MPPKKKEKEKQAVVEEVLNPQGVCYRVVDQTVCQIWSFCR